MTDPSKRRRQEKHQVKIEISENRKKQKT